MSINIKRLQEKIDYGSTGGSGGGALKSVTGTFTSPAESQGTIHIDCGFQPDIVQVYFPFGTSTKKSCSSFNKFIRNDCAIWDTRPIEGVIHFIDFASVTGETGICGIDETGFTFRTNNTNAGNKECSYIAYKI